MSMGDGGMGDTGPGGIADPQKPKRSGFRTLLYVLVGLGAVLVLTCGGIILYACIGKDVVGTVALKRAGEGVYELTKMAVTGSHQGFGIGRELLQAAIRRFQDLGGEKLFLESHSSLTRAILLYESAGFRHESPPGPSAYSRADVFMVYRGGGVLPA